MKRAAVYHRLLVTLNFTFNSHGRVELEQCVAERPNLSLVDWYQDVGFGSGASPQLDRLLADVQRRKVDVVVVWSLKRLARNMAHLRHIVQAFQEAGVDLVVLDQSIDTLSFDPARSPKEVAYAVMSAVTEFENHVRGQRIRSGMAAKKAQGKRVGRRPIPKKKQVRARRLRAEGHTYRQIGRALNISPRTAFTYSRGVDNYEA